MFLRPSELVKRFGLREGMHVGDFGAGSGHFSKMLAQAVGTSGRVFAIDLNEGLLCRVDREAKALGHANIEIVCWNMENDAPPLEASSLDAGLISNTLFQIEQKEKALQNVRRLLKPAGMLLVTDWAGSFNNLGPTQEQVFPEREARELLAQHGFIVEKVVPAGFYHYALIARKNVTDL